ncbi:hypothetical protein ATANTOWER_032799 [Ataeniobius toweri]|uniref:Uncharacterized protein n=1 Tax=Ataeniobius toweri TaxID=208326 RepID=A0ABU7AL71_9TELE|nr:hypothetical protein [Ataeniobius toweri]
MGKIKAAKERERERRGKKEEGREVEKNIGEKENENTKCAQAPVTYSNKPTGPPAAVYAGADPAMDPETPGHAAPSRGPAKQPLGVCWHTPKHPALDTENQQHTQRAHS